MATSIAIQQEALTRARSSQSLSNFAAIIRGFMAKGLAESEISPRENVFTYNAWKALGRQVKKGEHGVKCLTFIMQRDKRTGREEKRPWSTTVFHVSQTEKVGAIACNDALDATAENIPYAGEAELDTPELQAHSDAVHSGNINGYPEVCHDCGRRRTCDSAGQCHECRQRDLDREAEQESAPAPSRFTIESPFSSVPVSSPKPVEVIPAPTPKDSAYDRAMRGETVSIMDMIEEQQAKPKPAPKSFVLPRRLQSAVQSFQTKTVDF